VKPLTPKMERALHFAIDNGAVFPGYNERKGSRYTVAFQTIKALESRGLIVMSISPDGGSMGRPTAEGRTVASLLTSS
jgi:hypothetical protein